MHGIVKVQQKLCASDGGSRIITQMAPFLTRVTPDFSCIAPSQRWSKLLLLTTSFTAGANTKSVECSFNVTLDWNSTNKYLLYPVDSRISVKTSVLNRYGLNAYYKSGSVVATTGAYTYNFNIEVAPSMLKSSWNLAPGDYHVSMLAYYVKV